MITEQKIADLHELVRLFQEREKTQVLHDYEKTTEREYAVKGHYVLAGLHQDNACDIESDLMKLDEQIEALLTKHDLKI